MGTISRSHTFVAGETPTAAEFNVDIDALINLVNGNLDGDNVDTAGSDGICTLDDAQSLTGTKTFTTIVLGDISNVSNGAAGLVVGATLRYDPADQSQADNDGIRLDFAGDDDAATPNETIYGRIWCRFTDVSDGSEDAEFGVTVQKAGSLYNVLTIDTNGILPANDSDINLGAAATRFATVFADTLGDTGQALGIAATTLSFDTTSTIDTSGNNQLTIDTGTAALVLDADDIDVRGNECSMYSAAQAFVHPIGRTDTGVNDTEIAGILFQGDDTADNQHTFVKLEARQKVATSGSEDGELNIEICDNGTDATLVVQINPDQSYFYGGGLSIKGQLADAATSGFLSIPTTTSGAPSGTPSGHLTGTVPIVYDDTNNRLYIYNGSWRSVLFS